MPVLEHNAAIRQFSNEFREKHPHISHDDIDAVIKSFYNSVKKWIRQDDLPFIHIKFFGKFKVFPSRVKKLLVRYKRKMVDDSLNDDEKAFFRNKHEVFSAYLTDLNNMNANLNIIEDNED